MSAPHDNIAFDMAPNPDSAAVRKGEGEEERRQRTIIEIVRREAERAGIGVTTSAAPDPLAVPNPQRAEAITQDTTPRLIEFTRQVGRSVDAEEIQLPDGTKIRGLRAREGSRLRLAVNLTDLVELGNQALGFAERTTDQVVTIAVKVGKAIAQAIAGKGRGGRST